MEFQVHVKNESVVRYTVKAESEENAKELIQQYLDDPSECEFEPACETFDTGTAELTGEVDRV